MRDLINHVRRRGDLKAKIAVVANVKKNNLILI